MDDLSQVVDDIATDLWHRFRAMAMAINQADRFVGMPETGEAAKEENGWFKNLAQSDEEVNEIAEDLILRALRTALEPINYIILQELVQRTSASYSELMKASEMNRLSVSERVNDLIQVGLAVKDVQTDQVQGTNAAQSIVKFVKSTQDNLFQIIKEKLAQT